WSYTCQICGSKACSRGGLVADLALLVVHLSDLWEQSLLARRPDSRPDSSGRTPDPIVGACSRRRPDSRPGLWEWSDNPPGCSRFFRRTLAVAGWEGLSLVFSRRCKFSGRAWKSDK
ncbi:hypothetical protein CVG87_23200, partial [Pseudomonas sp. WCS365]